MPQQVNTLQRAGELVEQRIDLLARLRAAAGDERADRRTMPASDHIERIDVLAFALFGEPRAFEQLICDTLERRYDDDHRFGTACVQNDGRGCANGCRRGERRPAKLEDFHQSEQFTRGSCRSRVFSVEA